ncbi:hypothetical protein AXG93_3556s1220 [Marchantia polymorpha subsp. ruderalis]|uniref:Uncharacterized protein n=1 Tax=Marchantia polymorpha subsp. ruderalis TaxID=1480154 RepID=A0A176WKA9_MARPO|nr:hypothetical protein AXG93_3556s1220 [Marchantia polymorpha subsp. ruderalis]
MDSHDAELATLGMDSADHEPELPSAVQDLIRHLERRPPILSDRPLEEFFPERESLLTNRGWRSKVRLRVLEAIGSCKTFEHLHVEDFCGGNISRLSASEWELVLRGYRSSTYLQGISLWGLTWTSLAEMESLCLQLGRILGSSSVTFAQILDCGLSARCFLNLASGLRENSESKLKHLNVRNAWQDMTALKHVADLISSAANLDTFSFGCQSDPTIDMDDSAVRTLSQALIRSSVLEELRLEEVEGRAAVLLLNALAGDDGNRSIECLKLRRLSGIGDCIPELFTSNRSLRKVTLADIKMRPEECRVLGKAIRDNVTTTTINIVNYGNYGDPLCRISLEGLEQLACAASSDFKDPVLHLETNLRDNDALMSALDLLGRVLCGEIKSIERFGLITSAPGSNLERIDSILPMNEKTGETSVLKILQLSGMSENIFKGIWKQLLWNLRSNTSVTTLDLHMERLDKEAALTEEEFRDLMGLLQVNLTLRKIDFSTPWIARDAFARDGKSWLIQEALKQNQERAVYMSEFREAKLKFGDAKAGRLFLCGSPRADPNWLTNAFLGELIALGQDFQAQEFEAFDKTMLLDSYTSKDGFVSESVFAQLIETFLGKQPRLQNVDREVIEKILFNLDLCFKLEDTSQYFIPSFIREYASMDEQKHQAGAHTGSMAWDSRFRTPQFAGIRIQCEDQTTMSLTAAFFPRFQVRLNHGCKYPVLCNKAYVDVNTLI